MKIKQETTLFTVLTGSHLYGTATDLSDFDYKVVCLPSLDDLLLSKKIINRKEKPEGLTPNDCMIAGETETEYLPLQVFLNDFLDGQTYALEVAFAANSILNGYTPLKATKIFNLDDRLSFSKCKLIQDTIQDLIERFITRNVQKMVGYAISQSRLYGLKTQRYTAIGTALRLINQYGRVHVYTNEQREKLTLVDCPNLLQQLLALDHVKSIEILNAAGGKEFAPGIEICNKQYPLTNKVATIVKSLEKSLAGYGERVKEFDGEGVDWKALSHAIRITEQIIELSEQGVLIFPRPNAEFLLSVKNGKIPITEATEYLNVAFTKVDSAISSSVLQERTFELEDKFHEWKIHTLRKFYDLEN